MLLKPRVEAHSDGLAAHMDLIRDLDKRLQALETWAIEAVRITGSNSAGSTAYLAIHDQVHPKKPQVTISGLRVIEDASMPENCVDVLCHNQRVRIQLSKE